MSLVSNYTIKAFIFDMDGTVVNSTWEDYLAWMKLFDQYKIPFTYDEYIGVLGVKSAEVIQMKLGVTPEVLIKLLSQKLEYFKEIIRENGIKAFPYIEDLLIDIRKNNFKIALATGARRDKFNLVFEKIKLGTYFDENITGDEVILGKPNPEIFIKAANKLGLSPSEVVVFEDAENGVQAAKNAGCKCIAITTTTPREKLIDADLIIDSYKSINSENVLRNIFYKV